MNTTAWPRWLFALRLIPRDEQAFVCGLVCLGMFVRIFWDNLGHFYYAWTTDENYSHGFLVPLISLYFANRVASSGPIPIRGGTWLGSSLLVVSLVPPPGHDSVADPLLERRRIADRADRACSR